MTLTALLIGGPTVLLEYGGLRWLTDPSLSPPGEYSGLTKTSGPSFGPAGSDEVDAVDAVLLSHDQHSDNLDPEGRRLLPRAGVVLTTIAGAERLNGNAIGLAPWSTMELPVPDGRPVKVSAVPAQHGPDGSDAVMGSVIGFLLEAPGDRTVYVSGDNASVDVVRTIADRHGPVDVAVLFAGAVQREEECDNAYLTLSSDRAAEAARLLGARDVVPAHFEGWTHFTQGAAQLRAAFAGNGVLDRLRLITPGERITL